MNGTCALCLKQAKLQNSHIIPAFVYRWLAETSPGKLRNMDNPNVRIQDGDKEYLLCADCEQLFNKWETPFCEQLFLPIHNREAVSEIIHYEEWALKFAVSVSWRVLHLHMARDKDNEYFSPLQSQIASKALETWRSFLLGKIEHPGEFSQHLLLVDTINDRTMSVSPFINRYLLRNPVCTILKTEDCSYVYSKLCRFIIFGRIQEEHPSSWNGMQLHVKRGEIGLQKYSFPDWVFNYMNKQADEVHNKLKSLSQRQKAKIHEIFQNHAEIISESEVFRAMKSDVYNCGDEAFSDKF